MGFSERTDTILSNSVACKATFKQRSFFGFHPHPTLFFPSLFSLSSFPFFFFFFLLLFFLFVSVLLYVHRNHQAYQGRRTAFINQTTFEKGERQIRRRLEPESPYQDNYCIPGVCEGVGGGDDTPGTIRMTPARRWAAAKKRWQNGITPFWVQTGPQFTEV